MFKLLGMLLGGGAIPREAARAQNNQSLAQIVTRWIKPSKN